MSILLQEKQPKRPDSTGRPTMELNFFEDWSWEYPLLASETFRVKKENETARQNARIYVTQTGMQTGRQINKHANMNTTVHTQ